MQLIPHVPENLQGTLRASNTTGYQWSPDSRLFACSTTAPRMNVDNGVRLFRYTGEEIVDGLGWDRDQFKPDRLLEVAFVPPPADAEPYPDRPQTPPPPEAIAAAAAASKQAKAPLSSSSAAAAAPSSSYVPPSARAGRGGGGSSLAERLRKEKEASLQGATVVRKDQPSLVKSAAGKVIPGLAQQPQAKSKSALKREKAKLKKQQEEARLKEQQQQRQQKEEGQQQEQASQAVPEKRARKIKKTLKQIEDLKQKDPGSLNDDQKAKLESEESLRAELEQLGL